MPEAKPRFEILAFWDGPVSGLVVDNNDQVWYFDMQGDDVVSRERRTYNAWKLPEWPAEGHPIYNRNFEMPSDPDAHFTFTEDTINKYRSVAGE